MKSYLARSLSTVRNSSLSMMVYTTQGVTDTNCSKIGAVCTLESFSLANELSTVGTSCQHMLLKPRLSTVSNVDWTNVRVGAFKATASTARHHQSQSQIQSQKWTNYDKLTTPSTSTQTAEAGGIYLIVYSK